MTKESLLEGIKRLMAKRKTLAPFDPQIKEININTFHFKFLLIIFL